MRVWRPICGLLAACLVVACGASAPAPDHDYPAGPYSVRRGATLPDSTFEGVSGEGAKTTIHLHDFVRDEAATPRVLVIQESGGLWCGTCRWTAGHFDEVLGPELGARVDRLDLVIGSRDNAPATADGDALAWQSSVGATGTPVGVDPSFQLEGALEGVAAPLPLLLFVDEASMRVLDVLSNPAPRDLAQRLANALAKLDGVEPAELPAESLVDGLFHENEWEMFTEMATVPGAPPPDPTNQVADSVAAQDLGRALFFDKGLSPSGTVACSTCHDPDKALSDGRPRGVGVGVGDRRTPSIALSAHARWQMWDGRADTLWAQALGPLENATEFASSRTFVARRVLTQYPAQYRAAFPDAPLPDPASWPSDGKPGTAAYDALPSEEQHAITEIFVHAGKAIAAYERTFRVQPNAFDDYVHGDSNALNEAEKYGLLVFARSGCMQCHWGPRFSDDAFHVTRTPTGRSDGMADRGRQEGLELWSASEFRADGPWSDAADATRRAGPPEPALGQFKTPSLRGVAELSFFDHGGVAASLSEVVQAYGSGGLPADDPACDGKREPWLARFGETAQWGLVPFLKTLRVDVLVSRPEN
jgi:cytochrome c peroxidase